MLVVGVVILHDRRQSYEPAIRVAIPKCFDMKVSSLGIDISYPLACICRNFAQNEFCHLGTGGQKSMDDWNLFLI